MFRKNLALVTFFSQKHSVDGRLPPANGLEIPKKVWLTEEFSRSADAICSPFPLAKTLKIVGVTIFAKIRSKFLYIFLTSGCF